MTVQRHCIPAYAVCRTNKHWLWAVWTQKQFRVSHFEKLIPTHIGKANSKAEAIAEIGKILDLDLLSCKIRMVSYSMKTGEGIPIYQFVPYWKADVVQLWSTSALVGARKKLYRTREVNIANNWETKVIGLAPSFLPLKEGGEYIGEVDRRNGEACEPTKANIKVHSRYINQGGWILYNIVLDGKEKVTMSEDCSMLGGLYRFVIYNQFWNFHKRSETLV
jgi:hypothetical protein